MNYKIKKLVLTFIVFNVFMTQSVMADMLFYYNTAILPSVIHTKQVNAIDKIEAYAASRGTESIPTLQDYINAGVIGVTENNLVEINEVIGNLTPEDVDTVEEIQALQDALGLNTDVDITPPVITLNGSATVTITVGDSYTDAGATAIDDVDGMRIPVKSGTVDTSTAGTYTIIWTATDAAGNEGSATRTVNVTDASEDATLVELANNKEIEIWYNISQDEMSERSYLNNFDPLYTNLQENFNAENISCSDLGDYFLVYSTPAPFMLVSGYESATDSAKRCTESTLFDVVLPNGLDHNYGPYSYAYSYTFPPF